MEWSALMANIKVELAGVEKKSDVCREVGRKKEVQSLLGEGAVCLCVGGGHRE